MTIHGDMELTRKIDEVMTAAIMAAKPANEFDGGPELLDLANKKLGDTGAVCSRVKIFRLPYVSGWWCAKAYMEGGDGTPYTTGWCFLNYCKEA